MGRGRGRRDPFGNYLEWSEHRYNPGHYLGGTLEPHLRKSSLGHRARRKSGLMLLIAGISGLVFFLVLGGGRSPELPRALNYLGFVVETGLSLLTVVAGLALYRAGRRPSRTTRAPPRR